MKFHFKTAQGIKCISGEESARQIGEDRETHQADLYNAIAEGDFPKWAVKVQVMNEAQAQAAPFNPFDLTKVWPHKDFPLIEIGELELNRNPENYFADIEQAAFSPASTVPGIGFSPDKVLQARLFAYADAQRYRLGANHMQIPANQPRCPVNSYQRDGTLRVDGNGGGSVNYEPNGFGGPAEDQSYAEPPLPLYGDAAHHDHREGNDDYTQAGQLFRLMPSDEQNRLMETIAGAMSSVPEDIQRRQLGHFSKADPYYGQGIAKRLGLKI